MRSQPAQGLYHTAYAINNLYEPPSWLKHVGNVLLLQEPQTPNPKTLVACFQSAFNCITKFEEKKKRTLRLLLLKKPHSNGGCKLGNLQNEARQQYFLTQIRQEIRIVRQDCVFTVCCHLHSRNRRQTQVFLKKQLQ